MHVILNGEPRTVPDQVTVREMLEHLGLTEGPVAVEINRAVVPRADHGRRQVEEADVIEVVHLVGGG